MKLTSYDLKKLNIIDEIIKEPKNGAQEDFEKVAESLKKCIKEEFKKLLKENNLPDIRWHDLRKTYCTLLLKNNFSPKTVSVIMGHAKELITVDVYGDNDQIIEDCLDELEPFIEEILPKDNKNDFSNDEEYINIIENYIMSFSLNLSIK